MRSFSKKRLMRRAGNFTINRNPKPNEIIIDQSSFLFSSLPNDVVLNCFARVPRCYYPNLSCVSKSFQALVRSPELAYMRSIIDRHYPILYVCYTEPTSFGRNVHWFAYDPHEKKTSTVLNSIPHLPQHSLCCSVVSIGSTIYFIGGSKAISSPRVRVFHPWSGELCEGPSMKVARMLPGVAVVDGKIYVMGGCTRDQIQVEVFDPKTQTWEVGPVSPPPPDEGIQDGRARDESVSESVAVEGKVYGMRHGMSLVQERYIIYDTKDGRCKTFKMADEQTWWRGGACVINNVIYVYYTSMGLMWYDTEDKVWSMVRGLKLDKPVGMVDCNGKLAFLWEDRTGIITQRTKKKLWCTLIALDRCGDWIRGTVKWSELVGSVPIYYDIWRCLNVSD